jgi:anti-anti-sigma regulatory factor
MNDDINTMSDNQLKLEINDIKDVIEVHWIGKSIQRNPSQFILPLLTDVIKRGIDENKLVVWDFRKLDFMNSSTITPMIKTLELVRKGSGRIKIIYNKQKKWQDLSFSALLIFETKDGRVQIEGV